MERFDGAGQGKKSREKLTQPEVIKEQTTATLTSILGPREAVVWLGQPISEDVFLSSRPNEADEVLQDRYGLFIQAHTIVIKGLERMHKTWEFKLMLGDDFTVREAETRKEVALLEQIQYLYDLAENFKAEAALHTPGNTEES